MTDHPLAVWHRLVSTRDPSTLNALLAENVVFHSPVVHTPQRGRMLARSLATGFAAFEVTNELKTDEEAQADLERIGS